MGGGFDAAVLGLRVESAAASAAATTVTTAGATRELRVAPFADEPTAAVCRAGPTNEQQEAATDLMSALAVIQGITRTPAAVSPTPSAASDASGRPSGPCPHDAAAAPSVGARESHGKLLRGEAGVVGPAAPPPANGSRVGPVVRHAPPPRRRAPPLPADAAGAVLGAAKVLCQRGSYEAARTRLGRFYRQLKTSGRAERFDPCAPLLRTLLALHALRLARQRGDVGWQARLLQRVSASVSVLAPWDVLPLLVRVRHSQHETALTMPCPSQSRSPSGERGTHHGSAPSHTRSKRAHRARRAQGKPAPPRRGG